jgi:hypothetical protein
MKLTQSTLPQYFSIADSTSSWYSNPTNTFDFVGRNSNTLVVTVGDSWTWGSDLSPNNCDDQFRKQHTYGYVVAQQLNSDWLNLALCAQGNFWMASMVDELSRIIPSLEYDCIHVISTFTGVLRWFNTKYDLHIDYISWFRENIQCHKDFDKLLVMLNQHCVDSIQASLCGFDHVTVKFATNFIDAIGFDSLKPEQILAKPWYQILDCHDTDKVYGDTYYNTVYQAVEFLEPEFHGMFKSWLLGITDKFESRLKLLEDPSKFSNYHPLADGHQKWAHYILENLQK